MFFFPTDSSTLLYRKLKNVYLSNKELFFTFHCILLIFFVLVKKGLSVNLTFFLHKY